MFMYLHIHLYWIAKVFQVVYVVYDFQGIAILIGECKLNIKFGLKTVEFLVWYPITKVFHMIGIGM